MFVALAMTAVTALGGATAAATTTTTSTPSDPADWSNHRLAEQLVLAGIDMSHVSDARAWASHGIGGIVLFGTPPSDLGRRLAAVRSAEVVPPLVASDEEGGLVQRLASLIYSLPSAEWMGAHRTPSQVEAIARRYGSHMKALGVDMDLAPVSDLLVSGHYIAQTHRAFSSSPTTVAHYVNAWQRGMRSSNVVATAKHWPGHGHATDTHEGLAVTPKLSYLEAHDLVPFVSAMSHDMPVVMVGHLVVPGLTESSSTPASLSPRAMRYLRNHGGADKLVITDSLSMGAIRTSLGLSQPQAAVRALRAGADMALVQDIDPAVVVDRIAGAITNGRYPRRHAVASVRRVLAAKRISTPPAVPTARRPADGATGLPLEVRLSALLNDRLGGQDRARFSVRTPGASTWNVVGHASVSGPAGARVTYVVPAGRLSAGHRYEWRLRSCNSAGRCSRWTSLRSFTTAS